MRRNLHLVAGIACISWAFGACSSDDSSDDDGSWGNAGTAGSATGGSSGSSGSSGSGGTTTGGGGSGGSPGGSGGSAGNAGGAGGAAGAQGGGGTGGTVVIPPYCDGVTAKTPPYLITTLGSYVPSGWFPETGPADMSDLGGCPSTEEPGTDAGAGDAGDATDAGEVPEFANCLGIAYEQADPLNVFAGINWVPAPLVPTSCFTGVGAVEFWVSGTPGSTAVFEAFGVEYPVLLTAEWQKHSIDINTNLNAGGVAVAFTMKFEAASGVGPFNTYVADITYVE